MPPSAPASRNLNLRQQGSRAWRILMRWLRRDRYRPERRYMRGRS